MTARPSTSQPASAGSGPAAQYVVLEAVEHDVPAQRPTVAIPVDAVQIINQKVPFTLVDDLFGRVEIVCDLVAGCDLPADQRGIHMSRIEQAADVSADDAVTLAQIALLIAARVARAQNRPSARAALHGDVILRNRTAITGHLSLDRIGLSATATLGACPTLSLGITATNMTACPCMQAYALDDLVDHHLAHDDEHHSDVAVAAGRTCGHGEQELRASLRAGVPVATHSQKGQVTLTVRVPLDDLGDRYLATSGTRSPSDALLAAAAQLPKAAELYAVLREATTLTSELLKRPDEYEMVKRAHRRAQFVEDVARETARVAAERLVRLRADAHVAVQTDSFESIHGHDIRARLAAPVGQLRDHAAPAS